MIPSFSKYFPISFTVIPCSISKYSSTGKFLAGPEIKKNAKKNVIGDIIKINTSKKINFFTHFFFSTFWWNLC
jgi:hypothetical protein